MTRALILLECAQARGLVALDYYLLREMLAVPIATAADAEAIGTVAEAWSRYDRARRGAR